jgi:hypothetical protein
MAIQTTSTLNPILTKIANQFMRDPKGFVADRLSPPFPTALQSANYYMFGADELANVPILRPRAPGSGYPRITSVLSNDNYYCQNYGLEGLVPDEERAKYGAFFDADVAKVRKIVDTVRVNREIRLQTLVTNPNLVSYAGVGAKWDDPTSSPKDDVDAAKEFIRLNSGMEVNVMVIPNPVFLKLQEHPKLLDLFKYTSSGLMNEDKLANYFGLPQGGLVIAKAVQATNLEGQVFTPADIWGHNCILGHAESGDDLELPNFSRTFYWTAFTSPVTPATGGTGPGMAAGSGGGPDLIEIMDYRDETKKSDVHRGEHYVGEKIVGAKAGFLLQNVLSF